MSSDRLFTRGTLSIEADERGDVRILHVDDEQSFLDVTATLLERERDRFTVVSESDPEAVLDRLEAAPVDCIVSDYQMPRQNGLELLDTVREEYPELPYILFTGKGNEEIASKAISRGVTDYLRKRGDRDQFTVLANRIGNAVEQRRTRKRLEKRTRHLEKAKSAGDIGTWYKDIGADEIYWSSEMYSMFGISPERATMDDESFLALVHPADESVVDAAWQDALDGEPYDIEHRIVVDGETRWVRGRADIEFEDGEPVEAVGIVQDITEQRRRRQRLRVFREAVKHAGHAIYWADTDGRIEYVNPAFEEMTGYSRAEVVGKNPRVLKSGDHDEQFYERLWETITAGDVWKAELTNERKNGEQYHVVQTIAPVTDENGEIERFVAVNVEVD